MHQQADGRSVPCGASGANGEFDGARTLQPAELNAAHALSAICFGHSTLQDLPEGCYRATRQQSVEIISCGDRPVCQMGLYYSRLSMCASQFRVASIGGVCTHPDHRGLGLATRLLHHSFEEMRYRGVRLVLISGTRGLYQRAGCAPAQLLESMVLRREQLPTRATDVAVRPASGADAALCASLHQRETVHFVRKVEEFQRAIISTGGDLAGDNWIVESDGRPVGYVFLRTPWSHRPEDRVRELMLRGEWGGSRTALVEALPHLMERCNLSELWLASPWQEADLGRLLHSHGVRGDSSTMFGHTLRLLDFPLLMGDLRDYVTARLTSGQRRGLEFGQEGDCYTVSRGTERLVLDGKRMTRLVLGAPADPDEPQPMLDGDLGEIVAGLFPLPSFLPGLNCR